MHIDRAQASRYLAFVGFHCSVFFSSLGITLLASPT